MNNAMNTIKICPYCQSANITSIRDTFTSRDINEVFMCSTCKKVFRVNFDVVIRNIEDMEEEMEELSRL